MFSQASKLAVLESKLSIYEELSREMLDKLEAAVDKISEGNNRIATILTKHDERIDQSIKTDALIIKMIEDMKKDNGIEFEKISGRIGKVENNEVIQNKIGNIETKIGDLTMFRWITVGIATTIAVIISSAGFFGNILTTGSPGGTVRGSNTTLTK